MSLLLTHSLAGPASVSLPVQFNTDPSGQVQVPLGLNGDYAVNIEAVGYQGVEAGLEVQCDPADCAACRPSLAVTLAPHFCPDKALPAISNGVFCIMDYLPISKI